MKANLELKKFNTGMYNFNHNIVPYLDSLNGEKKEDYGSVKYNLENGQTIFVEIDDKKLWKVNIHARCNEEILKKIEKLNNREN